MRKKSGLPLITFLIRKVLPEGTIKNILETIGIRLLIRYLRKELPVMLKKYDIKVILKVNERIYEFGNGNIIFYIDDEYDIGNGFHKWFSKDGKQKNDLLFYRLVMEYWWQINKIVINEEYEGCYKPKPGDIVIDAGAFMGVFTVKTAKTVGERGLVIAIEPDSDSVRYLRKNLDLNGLHNVIVINKALWSSCGETEYKKYTRPALSAVAVLKPNDESDFGLFKKLTMRNIEKVPTTTIDDVVSDLCLNHVDLIKMNIECSEIEAIKGAKDTLTKFKPKLAIAGHHKIPPEYKSSYEILAPMLKDIGYNIKIAETTRGIGCSYIILYANNVR